MSKLAHVTIRDMVKHYLERNGFDGLWSGPGCDACGCGVDDLFPCDEPNPDACVVAKRGEDGLFYPPEGGSYQKQMEA